MEESKLGVEVFSKMDNGAECRLDRRRIGCEALFLQNELSKSRTLTVVVAGIICLCIVTNNHDFSITHLRPNYDLFWSKVDHSNSQNVVTCGIKDSTTSKKKLEKSTAVIKQQTHKQLKLPSSFSYPSH